MLPGSPGDEEVLAEVGGGQHPQSSDTETGVCVARLEVEREGEGGGGRGRLG